MRRLFLILLLTSHFSLIPLAHASDYQQCTTSSTCTIGEFLYDDSYAPLTGASCTLTSKYPDNTTYLNSVAMTGGADGWYSYTATLGTVEGLYHSNICCTPAGGTLCIDKTFEVKAPSGSSLTPAAIWGYSDRTLTGYGTLVNDIWSASSRSLTSFGSLVSDIWGYSGRTMTSFGSLVENIWGAQPSNTVSGSPAPSTLQNIMAEQTRQRELLEKLVNAPIVTLSLEDNETPELSVKLENSKKQAGLLYDAVQSTKSRLLILDGKWTKLSADALTSELTSISKVWTDPVSLATLTTAWNNPIIESLNQESIITKNALTSLIASASVSKSGTTPAQLFTAIESLTKIESDLGDVTSVSGDTTLFGYLEGVAERDSLLGSESKKISSILEDWDGQGEAVLAKKIKDSQDRLLAINQFPGGEDVVKPSNPKATGKAGLKNLLFSLQGLIGLNRNILASSANSPVRGLWLEEGSIIFRAVITNPSKIISQTAPLKFYLPKELKSEDIMTIDPALSAGYDTVAESLVVTGNFELGPGATKIVAVEVNDVWQLNSDELIALKSKATDLAGTLDKTSYLSQGLVLKNSIQSDIDKLARSANEGVKPENRIRNYREAQLALASTRANMTQLENLVAQAGGNSTLMGFVGGVSTTAVFGIVLVIVAGFIFMSTYFKKLAFVGVSEKEVKTKEPASLAILNTLFGQQDSSDSASPHLSRLDISQVASRAPAWQMPAIITAVVLVTAGGTIALTRMGGSQTPASISEVAVPSPIATPTPTPTPPASSEVPKIQQDGVVSPSYILEVPSDSTVNIRNKPSSDADIIMPIKETQDIYVFKESGDWRQIGFKESDSTKGYWVHSKFIIEK